MRYLRSPFSHARVTNIDASEALALPGVHAALTGEDVKDLRTGNFYRDEPILASWDVLRFIGDKVAAVVADDKDTADRALSLIDVDYDVLPALHDAQEAAKETAFLIHPDFDAYARVSQLDEPSNVYGHMTHYIGDVASGFAESDLVVERTYTTQRTHQAYLEPHACTVWIDPEDGRVHVWVTTQNPIVVRNEIARLASLPREEVIVHPSLLGGSFGGKGDGTGAFICYLFAKATGRPVKFVMNYAEELMAMDPRHASNIRVKAGVKRDGSITAWETEAYFPSGAYTAYAPVPPLGGLLVMEMVNSYRIPHVKIDSYQVYTNTVPGGYYRGPGIVQGTFAAESHMDVIAKELGIDPVELRLKNLVRASEDVERSASSWKPVAERDAPDYQNLRFEDVLRAAVDASNFNGPKLPNVGRGIVIHDESEIGLDGHAAVHVHPDGRIVANTPTPDPGGGTHHLLAQVVAEELKVPMERVEVAAWSSDESPPDRGAGAQRGARMTTIAGYEAAHDLITNLKKLAAEFLGWDEERISLEDGRLQNEADGDSVAIQDVAARVGEVVSGKADVAQGPDSPYTSFAAHVAEVSVDPETGEVRLLNYTAVHETGRVLNPIGFHGQIEGGIVQGIGQALTESLDIEDGRVVNPSLAEYKLPTGKDVPPLHVVVLESPEGNGPYKIRGIGDMPISMPSAAIANAVADAVGARVQDLPITPERVLQALE